MGMTGVEIGRCTGYRGVEGERERGREGERGRGRGSFSF